MSNFLLNDIRFLFDGRDLSGDGNAFSAMETFKMEDATRLTDTAQIHRPGLTQGKFSYAGFSQYGSGLVEETIANHKGVTTDIPILLAKSGNAGDRCQFLNASQATLDVVGGKVGGIQGFSIDGVLGKGHGIIDGTVLDSGKTSITTSGQTTGVNAGAALSTQSVYAIIQVLAFVGTTLTLKIQSSATQGGSYTDRFTQAGITAIGGFYLVPLPGPVTDAWWRVDRSGTFTSFQAAVAIGIR